MRSINDICGITEALNPMSQMNSYQNAANIYSGLSQYHGLGNSLGLGQWGDPFASAHAQPDGGAWDLARAESWSKDGYELRDRIEFWSAFGLLGWIVNHRLAPQLDRITDQIEASLQYWNKKRPKQESDNAK